MQKILTQTDNIKSLLKNMDSNLELILEQNHKLKVENTNLKKECSKALSEIEKCLKTIEKIQDQNGHNHN